MIYNLLDSILVVDMFGSIGTLNVYMVNTIDNNFYEVYHLLSLTGEGTSWIHTGTIVNPRCANEEDSIYSEPSNQFV